MKRWVAFLVVCALVLMVLPKEWSHECSHSHNPTAQILNKKAENHSKQLHFSEDCSVCDYFFQLHEPNLGFSFPTTRIIAKVHDAEATRISENTLVEARVTRGPPILA